MLHGATAGGGSSHAGSHGVSLLGCRISALTFAETLAEIETIVQAGTPVQHCVVNASKIVLMDRDERLRQIVASCPLVNADGQAVVWAARILGVDIPERVTGIDLFVALLEMAEEQGHSVYFLGAAPDVVETVVHKAAAKHPRLRISGSHHGYWDTSEDVVAQIRAESPDILFVGMPSPRKEYWLADNLVDLAVPFAMGVGGSFDVYAGKVMRAPLWMQRAGMEWFYRFLQEPRRLWRRYLLGNASFVWMVARELVRRRASSADADTMSEAGSKEGGAR